jgi:hypothetical protein
MRQESIKLPSGAEVILRQLLMREENMLAQAARSRGKSQSRVLNDVLDSCLVEWVELGPYRLDPEAKPSIKDFLMGDKFVMMVELRLITYRDGNLYTINDVECPSGSCPPFDFEVDIKRDMMHRDLTPEDAATFAEGKPFECTIDGHVVTFSLADGRTEERLEKLHKQHPGRPMACTLRSRIVDVEGVDRRDIMDWLDGNNGESKQFDGLGGQECEDLRDAMDLHECGIDTEVLMECPHCGREAYIDVPFDSGFLLPSKGILARKKQRRRGRA